MLRSTAFASLAILGALAVVPTPVLAQAPLNFAAAPTQGGNVVGGGSASLNGGADDMTITYSGGGAGSGVAPYAQPGRIAIFGGNSGGSPYWIYAAAAASVPGREAWLLGGGDDSQVVYASPLGARRR